MKWVVMEKYEKSLLQMWQGWRKPDSEEYGTNNGMFPYPYAFETRKSETAENNGQEKIQFKLEEPKDTFIRFVCACGKKVKAPGGIYNDPSLLR